MLITFEGLDVLDTLQVIIQTLSEVIFCSDEREGCLTTRYCQWADRASWSDKPGSVFYCHYIWLPVDWALAKIWFARYIA